MIKIKELKTEYIVNPIGINTHKPRFSWILQEDSDKQIAYRVQVFSKSEKIWDSGKVNSSETLNIEYRGREFFSREALFVEAEAFSENGRDKHTGTFETGLLKESDWTGCWTGTNANFTDTAILARKEYDLPEGKIARARAYIIGLGYHELSLNGKKVGKAFLSPSLSDWGKTVYYKTYDITGYLKSGANVITLSIGNGWYGRKNFLAQIFIEYENGKTIEDFSCIDGKWWIGRSYITRNSVFDGETHDNVLKDEIGDYTAPGFVPEWNKGWMLAFHQLSERGEKLPDLLEEIEISAEYEPVKKTIVKGDFVYDFGQNMAGFVKLEARGDKGTSIKMRFAEDVKEDGTINQLNLRTASACDELILCGNGTEVFEPKFTYHGFRYMQLSVEGKAEILSVKAFQIHNAVKQTGYFRCSDAVLNKLHNNVLMTEKNNLHSIMTDCPQRDERIGWLNDLSSRLYQNTLNFDLSRMLSKIARDIFDTQKEDGAIADTAPYFAGTSPADPICISYLLTGIMAYRYYGDKKVTETYYRSFEKWVNFLISRCNDKGTLELSYYGDWVVPEIYADTRVSGEYISTAYLYWHMNLMSEAAEIVGLKNDASLWRKKAEALKKTINDKWLDRKTCNYENGSQTANSLALGIGLAPEELRDGITENIRRDVVARNYHNTSGNQGYRHFYYAMAEAGQTQLLIDVLKNTEYPGFGNMLSHGATTIWERWESEMQMEMHSFDHPMFSAFDGIFYRYLAGIRVQDDACGCDKVIIKPEFNNELQEVAAEFVTVRGKIISRWKKENGGIYLKVKAPKGITVTFGIDGESENVRINKGDKFDGCDIEVFVCEKI